MVVNHFKIVFQIIFEIMEFKLAVQDGFHCDMVSFVANGSWDVGKLIFKMRRV